MDKNEQQDQEAREILLKRMHKYMVNFVDDEELYEEWIMVMPDEPSDEDFEFIAQDPAGYKECLELFAHLVVVDKEIL